MSKDGRDFVRIDGKTQYGGRETERRSIRRDGAWAREQQFVIGQIAADEKTNEITAVLNLLDCWTWRNASSRRDAVGCRDAFLC